MKNYLILFGTFLAVIIGLFSFTTAETKNKRTEDYAIISVFQEGKVNYISVTVGSTPTTKEEFQREKAAKQYDMAPVIREMEKLNEQGFELVSSSTSVIPFGTSTGNTGGSPFYSFTFKRKLQ
ncbi:hypothetical protein I5M27_00565 [Adhaeribacter sp. BT258]|uniref:DUF541 domain-containing protein n=1 Tax=Adhaeribacter terrigena TaxID=2793070 RepID=A0ABS1BX61_9BACT|nr:hypothetical protein [Adhaeribacter terrigena]MBK0401452.1 hypothetical protein [Adhaeribacter terrigena]